MANNVGVRQYLQGQGVQNSDIGYDPNSGNVTVKGQNFLKPALNMAGTTYDSQQNLDSAYGNYTKQQAAGQAAQPTIPASAPTTPAGELGKTLGSYSGLIDKLSAPASSPQAAPGQYTNPYTQQIADLMKHLSDTSSAAPADVYSSPQYAAAQAAQARQSADAIRQSNEAAAGAGLGHSTIMTDRAQKTQDDSNNYLATQLVPQIQSQLAAQKQQEVQNEQAQLNDYMNLGNHADTQHQQDIANADADRNFQAGRTDAATAATGIYNPSGQSADQIQAQMDANSKAYATATPEQQQVLHAQNLALAAELGKTFDPGTGTYSQGQGFAGTKTVAQQQLELNNAKDMAALTGRMPDGTLTNAAQQQQLTNEWTASEKLGVITPALAQLYGLPEGTPTEAAKQAAAQLAISQQNADTSQQNANTSQQNANTSATNSTNSQTNAEANNKINADRLAWEKSPDNPANAKNVSLGAKYDAQTGELLNGPSKKDSTDNYNSAISQMQAKKGLTQQDAQTYAQSIKTHLTDTDYAKLNNWITTNIFK